MTVEFRPMRHADAAAAAQLAASSVATMSGYSTEVKAYIAHLYDRANLERTVDQCGNDALVGQHGGDLLVMGLAHGTLICGVYVAPAWQRGGLGRRIMALLEARLTTAGHRQALIQANPDAVPFYDRLGYGLVSLEQTQTQPSFQIANMLKNLTAQAGRSYSEPRP